MNVKKLVLFFVLLTVIVLIYWLRPKSVVGVEQDTNSRKNIIKIALKSNQISTDDKMPRSETYKIVLKNTQNIKTELDNAEKSKDSFHQAMKYFSENKEEYKNKLIEAIKLDDQNISALGHYSELLLNEGNVKDSREYSMQCLSVDPTNSICHRSLISSFTRFGNFDEAYDYLLDCIDLDPENVNCLSGLNSTLLHLNEFEGAGEVIDQLESLDENGLWTHLAKASYFHKTKQDELALKHFEVACEKKQPYACRMVKELNKQY